MGDSPMASRYSRGTTLLVAPVSTRNRPVHDLSGSAMLRTVTLTRVMPIVRLCLLALAQHPAEDGVEHTAVAVVVHLHWIVYAARDAEVHR